METRKIIVAENDPSTAETIKQKLESLGYYVPDVIEDGDTCLDAVQRIVPDLIFINVRLPGVNNGWDTGMEIQRRFNLPVIFISESFQRNEVQKALSNGSCAFLIKPFPEEELLTTIETILFRHRKHTLLQERELWLKTTLNSIGEGVISTDIDGRVKFLNPAAENLTEWPISDAFDRDLFSIFVTRDEINSEADRKTMHVLLSDPSAVISTEKILISRTGTETPISLTLTPIRDEHGRVFGSVLVFNEISERKLSERRIQHRLKTEKTIASISRQFVTMSDPGLPGVLEMLAELFDLHRAYIFLLDENESIRKIAEWHAPWTEPRQSFYKLASPQYRRVFLDLMLSSRCWIVEDVEEITTSSGVKQALLNQGVRATISVPITSMNGSLKGYMGLDDLQETRTWPEEDVQTLRIVSEMMGNYFERKKAVEERIRLEAQLRQKQKLESLGTLASGVAHEINNPLMGIINFAELIYDRLPAETDSRLREFAKGIIEEGGRISKIVKNLLAFSRQEKESRGKARVSEILDRTLSLIERSLKKDHIHLILEIDENLPDIHCRAQQIQQVLLNLINNAKDALNQRFPEGDENKILSIRASTIEVDHIPYVRTEIKDTGSGIPGSIIGRIFDPFFTTKPRDSGTGLGLSVSYGIVKEHGGDLSVESREGSYTRFFLDLPVDSSRQSRQA